MSGVKGAGGQVPKRSEQRRRRNKPTTPITEAPAAATVPRPRARAGWHPIAKAWFTALGQSGQSAFYEPSDWATATIMAELMSRELRPKVIGMAADGEPVVREMPPSAAAMSAFLRGSAVLLATEGDRRRLSIELQRPSDAEELADVDDLEEYRRRIDAGAV